MPTQTNIIQLLIALSKYGLKEIAGDKDNEEIISMARELNFKNYIHDEISWCALFANWVLKQCNKETTGSLMARSHVGFFISVDENNFYVLAGNQSNMVNISAHPKENLLGFRRV
jgi:hypothetical protein